MKPILDRVFLRKVEGPEVQNGVFIPDQYKESDKYEVVAIGEFLMLGGQRIPLAEIVSVGDLVLVGQYNIEACEVDGEKLWITRVQDIRGRKHVATRSKAAA